MTDSTSSVSNPDFDYTPPEGGKGPLFGKLSRGERAWLAGVLRDETVGGILLLIAATAALVMANSRWGDTYASWVEYTIGPVIEVGPPILHLDLNMTLGYWAADAMLAIFFFVAGVELRHELQLGTLANPAKAAVPIAAAIGGMAVPAILYAVANSTLPDGELRGWGIPMATDIAFALAVLAVVGRRLPVALRAFLLSLAVVDDIGAIIVIAVFYSKGFTLSAFLISVGLLATYGILQFLRVRGAWIYVTLAVLAWAYMFQSGVHATIAGVVAGLLTRVKRDPGEKESPGHRAEHILRPISAGFAVPFFAFFAAGVDLRGQDITATVGSPIAIGIILGLVIGKPIGVVGTAWLMSRFTRASLSTDIQWRDVFTIGLLAGIGFTVSLLITELAFYTEPSDLASGKVGVLTASLISATVATVALLSRNRHYAAVSATREGDYEQDDPGSTGA